MSSESERRGCLPGCDRRSVHTDGSCMRGEAVLLDVPLEPLPGPLDLVNRHPDIPVHVPLRNTGIHLYDMVLPTWRGDAVMWTPFRNVFPRWHSGKICYPLPSGNMVHVKPGCRC